jgi:hypothetical protein
MHLGFSSMNTADAPAPDLLLVFSHRDEVIELLETR